MAPHTSTGCPAVYYPGYCKPPPSLTRQKFPPRIPLNYPHNNKKLLPSNLTLTASISSSRLGHIHSPKPHRVDTRPLFRCRSSCFPNGSTFSTAIDKVFRLLFSLYEIIEFEPFYWLICFNRIRLVSLGIDLIDEDGSFMKSFERLDWDHASATAQNFPNFTYDYIYHGNKYKSFFEPDLLAESDRLFLIEYTKLLLENEDRWVSSWSNVSSRMRHSLDKMHAAREICGPSRGNIQVSEFVMQVFVFGVIEDKRIGTQDELKEFLKQLKSAEFSVLDVDAVCTSKTISEEKPNHCYTHVFV